MGYTLSYTTPWGKKYELLEEDWSTGLKHGGFKGLGGTWSDVTVTAPGAPGQVLDSQNISAMTGSITVLVKAELWKEFRAGFSTTLVGTLTLHDTGVGDLHAQVRLNGPLPPPDAEPEDEDYLEIEVPLVVDTGAWLTDYVSGTGIVNVTNGGDIALHLRIRWSGDGGVVTVPSGATFALPAVTEERILLLNTMESLAVLTPAGEVDYELMRSLSRQVLPEGVPPGKTRTYSVPTGAQLEYRVGHIDPWK